MSMRTQRHTCASGAFFLRCSCSAIPTVFRVIALCALCGSHRKQKVPVVHLVCFQAYFAAKPCSYSGERHGYNMAAADTHLTVLLLVCSTAFCGRRALSQQALVRPVWERPSMSRLSAGC